MSNLLEQASLVMIPSGYKEDVVYSEIPIDGSGDLQMTRASNGTRVNSAGLVEVCPWNLLPKSEVFALWNSVQISGNSITITDNFITAPNGTLTAAKVVFATFEATAQIFQNYSLSPTQNLTASLYAKVPSGTKQAYFGFFDGAFKTQLKTLTTEWQRIEYTSSVDAGTIRACWFYGDGGASNVEVHLWGGQLNIGSTAKPYFPTTDRLNVPRLTYQNGGGGCPSLLLEKQSTNLVAYSNQLDLWNRFTNTTKSVDTNVIDPEGNSSNKYTRNSTSTAICSKDTITISASTNYSFTYFAKKGNYSTQIVEIGSGANNVQVSYNFDTGALSNSSYGTQSVISSSAQSFGNGWVRITVVFTGLIISTNCTIYIGGVLNDFVYIYGAQLEASSYPTSYIPTTSSSATRVVDVCFKTGISSLIGQTEGVLFVDFVLKNNISSINRVISITETTWDTGGSIRLDVDYNKFTADFTNNGINSGSITYNTTPSENTRYKVAIAYKQNDCKLYINGVDRGSDTSTNGMPTCSQIYLNELGAGFGGPFEPTQFNQVALFKTKLTDAECIALTTI